MRGPVMGQATWGRGPGGWPGHRMAGYFPSSLNSCPSVPPHRGLRRWWVRDLGPCSKDRDLGRAGALRLISICLELAFGAESGWRSGWGRKREILVLGAPESGTHMELGVRGLSRGPTPSPTGDAGGGSAGAGALSNVTRVDPAGSQTQGSTVEGEAAGRRGGDAGTTMTLRDARGSPAARPAHPSSP